MLKTDDTDELVMFLDAKQLTEDGRTEPEETSGRVCTGSEFDNGSMAAAATVVQVKRTKKQTCKKTFLGSGY